MFEGSMVALVTPFKSGKVDEASLRQLVDFHVEAGTDVIVPCGTTGESATLSHEEHEQVISVVVKQAAGRVKILAGAGSNSTAEAIRLHKYCAGAGVDGTLHITPYYNKPTQEGLFQHFQAIAKSANLPVVLYNVPGRTCVNMLPDTVIRLSKIDNIVGIKEASGNLVQASEIISGVSSDFGLYSGEDALTYPLYALGARGVISVTANIVPEPMARQYKLIKKGDFSGARAIHEKLLKLHDVMFVETNPIPVKAALAMMGKIEEEYRLPLVPLSSASREKLRKILNEQGLIK